MALFQAPLERFLFQGVRFDLVAHAPQQVGGGLGGHDQWLDHGGWDLPQDAAHSPRDALLLVPTSSHIADGLGRVDDSLGGGDRKEELGAGVSLLGLWVEGRDSPRFTTTIEPKIYVHKPAGSLSELFVF